MTARALLKTEDLRRAAKVATETGCTIIIDKDGKITVTPPNATAARQLDYQPDFRL